MTPQVIESGIAALILMFVGTAAYADLSAQVVGVLDGDLIEVLRNGHTERIRLNGIDCPEKGQPFGKRAKHVTSELVFGKEVTLHTSEKDKHGHTIADVSLPDGTSVSTLLVRDGWCWWDPRHAPDNVILAELQRRARRSNLGLWADPDPVPPWEWSARDRSKPSESHPPPR